MIWLKALVLLGIVNMLRNAAFLLFGLIVFTRRCTFLGG